MCTYNIIRAVRGEKTDKHSIHCHFFSPAAPESSKSRERVQFSFGSSFFFVFFHIVFFFHFHFYIIYNTEHRAPLLSFLTCEVQYFFAWYKKKATNRPKEEKKCWRRAGEIEIRVWKCWNRETETWTSRNGAPERCVAVEWGGRGGAHGEHGRRQNQKSKSSKKMEKEQQRIKKNAERVSSHSQPE